MIPEPLGERISSLFQKQKDKGLDSNETTELSLLSMRYAELNSEQNLARNKRPTRKKKKG